MSIAVARRLWLKSVSFEFISLIGNRDQFFEVMEAYDIHIARLEAEIQYLKGLLDENGIPYGYETIVTNAMPSSTSLSSGMVV